LFFLLPKKTGDGPRRGCSFVRNTVYLSREILASYPSISHIVSLLYILLNIMTKIPLPTKKHFIACRIDDSDYKLLETIMEYHNIDISTAIRWCIRQAVIGLRRAKDG
jgi:hypothetical protein